MWTLICKENDNNPSVAGGEEEPERMRYSWKGRDQISESLPCSAKDLEGHAAIPLGAVPEGFLCSLESGLDGSGSETKIRTKLQ